MIFYYSLFSDWIWIEKKVAKLFFFFFFL